MSFDDFEELREELRLVREERDLLLVFAQILQKMASEQQIPPEKSKLVCDVIAAYRQLRNHRKGLAYLRNAENRSGNGARIDESPEGGIIGGGE